MRQPAPLTFGAHLRMDIVRLVLEIKQPRSAIEVGPGLAAASLELAAGREYVGYEPDAESYGVARSRLEFVSSARIFNQPVPDIPTQEFDLLVAFEVLEHIDDDSAALTNWTRWVKPGGTVLISVPARPERFSAWDEKAGHFRRYGRYQLRDLMAGAELARIEIRSYGMPLGYLLEWTRNAIARRGEVKESMGTRTAESGRLYQANRGRCIRAMVVKPFQVAQRPFGDTGLGTGFVAWGDVEP